MRLDFRRFASDQVAAYNRMQVEVLRALSPGRFITHNFMNSFVGFDHWAVAADLDFASLDSYPLGAVELGFVDDDQRPRWAETSHPDVAPFGHDVTRGLGRGRFWIMEQQPGPVNWAPWNPVPKPGMIRLFTWEALAHGAEVVSYFRWRQAPFGQEQMHAGLNLPDRTLSSGGREAEQVAAELKRLGKLPDTVKAPVALVFDYEAAWIIGIQPQGRDFSYVALVHEWYGAVRRLGLDVDILPPGAHLKGYPLVVVPCLPHVSEAALAAFTAADGHVIYGPRTGSKTRDFRIPDALPVGPLQSILPVRVTEVASQRPGLVAPVVGMVTGAMVHWREHVDTRTDVLARFADGKPAVAAAGRHVYVAGWPDPPLRTALMKWIAKAAGLATLDLPEAVRLRRRGDLTFAFNYGDEPWMPPVTGGFLIGGPRVEPRGVGILGMTKRVIHVGVGSFGRRWCSEFLAANVADGTIAVAAIVDVDEGALEFGRKTLGLPADACFTDAAAAFAARPADFCTVVVPPNRHEAVVDAALAHGLDILCEKPIADTMAGLAAHRPQGRRRRPQDGGDHEPPLRSGQDDAPRHHPLGPPRQGDHRQLPLRIGHARSHGLGRALPPYHAGPADDRGRGPPSRPGRRSRRRRLRDDLCHHLAAALRPL